MTELITAETNTLLAATMMAVLANMLLTLSIIAEMGFQPANGQGIFIISLIALTLAMYAVVRPCLPATLNYVRNWRSTNNV